MALYFAINAVLLAYKCVVSYRVPVTIGDHLNDIKTVRQACYLVQDILKAILILCSKCDRKMYLIPNMQPI